METIIWMGFICLVCIATEWAAIMILEGYHDGKHKR
jgi:hypothetical protein